MSTTTNNKAIQFRTFRQYKRHFAPSPEKIEIPEDKKNDLDYIWGMEIARKAFEDARRKIEEERKKLLGKDETKTFCRGCNAAPRLLRCV